MRFLSVIVGILWLNTAISQPTTVPIGAWKEYLPYNSCIDLAFTGSRVYAATPYSLISVDPVTNIVERLSRVTGLSETGISAIGADAGVDRLLIAYTNSNIDLIYRNDIINVPDIMRDNIAGDKSIYNVYSSNGLFYLSSGIAVIVLDPERAEIRDSWFIGPNGNPERVNSFTTDVDFFYAATVSGLKRTSIGNSNPGDYSNWELLSAAAGLPAGECKQVLNLAGKILCQFGDCIYLQIANQWSRFYTDGWSIVNANVSGDAILLSERNAIGQSRLLILGADGNIRKIIEQTPALSFPRKAILVNAEPWVADQFQSLSHFTSSGFESYRLNSPESIASGEIAAADGKFYASAGEVNDAWNYQYNGNGIYILDKGEWNNINRFRFPQLDTMLDFITIAIDKSDKSVWAGSFGGGLLQVKQDQSLTINKQSILSPAIGDPTSYRVAGLCFDRDNNLWISNYAAAQPLVARQRDGTITRFSVPFLLPENGLGPLLVDHNNYKWIVAVKGGGLLCFDHGNDLSNIGDDRWKRYLPGVGNGNLPNGDVLCIARDKSNFIWVGTTDGVGVIQCAQDVFSGGSCEAIWPIVKEGNFAGYLFKGESIQAIAVDGADRKWIATKNGVWLINATGDKLISGFNESNSPLLSNDVKRIAIDQSSGEVYFATSKGICSYRGTATETQENENSTLVFPNPVPPGYTGTIAIKGLVNDAIVKITEMDGRLVYQTRALGGQAVWNGKDYRGRKISTGVYLVLVADPGKKEKTSAKIIFIGQ